MTPSSAGYKPSKYISQTAPTTENGTASSTMPAFTAERVLR